MATVSAGLKPEPALLRQTGNNCTDASFHTDPPPNPSDVIFISKVRRSKEKEEEPHLVERTKVSSMKLTWMENTAESKQKKVKYWHVKRSKGIYRLF